VSFLSLTFAELLAVGLIVFHLAPARWRPSVLLALSLAFYASWTPWHTGVLLVATVGAFGAAQVIERCRADRLRLALAVTAVAVLLVLLSVFKCGQWIFDAARSSGSRWTAGSELLLLAPLGLSYFLFKLIGYLLDVYWGRLPATRSLVALALYASFFPQIVSGPIQRAGDFFGQLETLGRPLVAEDFAAGLRRILLGLVKKLVVADQLCVLVTSLHDDPARHSALQLLIAAYAFTLQLYADFSGLTDISLGVGRLFGVVGPENFDRPLTARNLQEFWRRWHMSLTSWLGDYLFTPLRMALRNLGNVGLVLAIVVNLTAVGVWHGPRGNYLAFGLVSGVLVAASALTLRRRNKFFARHPSLASLRRFTAPAGTFHLVVLAQILFQAPTVGWALSYYRQLLAWGPSATRIDWAQFNLSPLRFGQAIVGLALLQAIEWASRQTVWIARFRRAPRGLRWGLYYGLALLVLLSDRNQSNFIYAQF
jgi:alginate O-acetyltransferase complex protein AlgI